MTENYAAVLHRPNDVRIEKWPMPVVNDNEVLIKMHCVGICGSDLKLYTTAQCGYETLTEPTVLGHEGAGVVVKVGKKVTNLSIGDRVAIEPTQPCRSCAYCRVGRYNLCDEPRYCSSPGVHGNLCTYYKHVADFCHKIPDNVSMEEGAATQPLAIAVHACRRANLRLGSSLLVLGSGPIGVLCALTARSMGVANILMTDVVSARVEAAKKLVGCAALLMEKELSEEESARRMLETLGGAPDVTIDACGHEAAQGLAMTVTRSGGVVLVVGIGPTQVSVPLAAALLREVDVRGSFRLLNSYPVSLAALSSGSLNLKSFITHHYPLEKTKEALELAKTGDPMKLLGAHPDVSIAASGAQATVRLALLIDVKPLVTHHFSLEQTLEAYEVARQGSGIKVMIHVQPRDTNNINKFQ